jgi:4-diphosphocytidyl-2-C-methyl-D-erythritol kinase
MRESGARRPAGALAEFAPAKINLALHVLGRRADGFHLLDSLVVFAEVGDSLTASESDDLALILEGRFREALADAKENLVLRAARLLADEAGMTPRARIVLRKNLPVASGIGGGSADAAAALRLLSRLWRLDVPAADLFALAAKLGADVPVCLAGRPARMAGVGEALAALPQLPECGLLLVNPGVAVATASVFRARTGGFSTPLELPSCWPDVDALAATLRAAGNDLETPAIALAPVIADVLAALRHESKCLIARMSGSGATCFGLFATRSEAEAAAAALARPGWWLWGGGARG